MMSKSISRRVHHYLLPLLLATGVACSALVASPWLDTLTGTTSHVARADGGQDGHAGR